MNNEIVLFVCVLIKKIKDNELIQMANALSFKIILSIFPFLIFLITLLSYAGIDFEYILDVMSAFIPSKSRYVLEIFLNEAVYQKHLSILSSSFLIAVFSASSGFFSALKSLNLAFEIQDSRSYFTQRLVCAAMVLIFAFLISASLVILIFSDMIAGFFIKNNAAVFIVDILSSLPAAAVTVALVFVLITLTYIIAVNRKLKLRDAAPGSVFTMIFWLVFSKLFNIYINNFSKISSLYGSIGGIFIFFYWINLISVIFLIGGQINAVLLAQKN